MVSQGTVNHLGKSRAQMPLKSSSTLLLGGDERAREKAGKKKTHMFIS